MDCLGFELRRFRLEAVDKPPEPWHDHQNCFVQPSFPILFEDNTLNWTRLIAETRRFASWLGLTYFPPFAQHFTNSCWWMADLHLRPSGHLLVPRPPSPPPTPRFLTQPIDNAARKTNITHQMALLLHLNQSPAEQTNRNSGGVRTACIQEPWQSALL